MSASQRFSVFSPPTRILLGPGPSELDQRVKLAMARPMVGHLDPSFLVLMDEVRTMLRELFETQNQLTLAMSGTGTSGMETCLVNLLEPGDRVLLANNGVFGARMVDIARRTGAEVREVKVPWGEGLDLEVLRKEAHAFKPTVISAVHAETSTGVLNDLSAISAIAQEVDALLISDMVTSFSGMSVKVDENKVDAAFTATQKCLSGPPGLAPVTISPRALEKIVNRKTPVQSWYFDLSLIREYWGNARAYHHTAPVPLLYALHEACRLALEEGLEARIERHNSISARWGKGLEALGLTLAVAPEHRLPQLLAIRIPEGIGDEAAARRVLLERYGVEIGGGLGALKGKVWRVGVMGTIATESNGARLLSSLAGLFEGLGRKVDLKGALEAADLAGF